MAFMGGSFGGGEGCGNYSLCRAQIKFSHKLPAKNDTSCAALDEKGECGYIWGVAGGVPAPPAVAFDFWIVTRTDTDQLVRVFRTISVTLSGLYHMALPPFRKARLLPKPVWPILTGGSAGLDPYCFCPETA